MNESKGNSWELEIPVRIFAPFAKLKSSQDGKWDVILPVGIKNRLSDPRFTEDITPEKIPAHGRLPLIPTHINNDDIEVSIPELVKKHFDSQSWKTKVTSKIDKMFGSNDSNQLNDESNVNRRFDDQLFTVRLDNLPENEGSYQIQKFLRDQGIHYFERVVVPNDQVTGKPKTFGFLKFKHLRWALKFINENNNPKIRFQQNLINVQLVS